MTIASPTWTLLSKTARTDADPATIDVMLRGLADLLEDACERACDAHNAALGDGATVTYVLDPSTVVTHCTPIGVHDVLLTITGVAAITMIPADATMAASRG